MSSHGFESGLPAPDEHGHGEESGAAYRRRQTAAIAFGNIIRQLDENKPEEEKKPYDPELLLDAIAKRGLTVVGHLAWEGLQQRQEPYVAANTAYVRDYLANVRTIPPIKITDIGSIDEEVVEELGLTAENYVEELRVLLAHIDTDRGEVSVLELPDLQREMFALEARAFKDVVTMHVLGMHGIKFALFDREDQQMWADHYKLVEELSCEIYRDFSRYLRNKKSQGKTTTIRDVYDGMADIVAAREKAVGLARENANATPQERARMLEMQNPIVREQLERFFADLDRLRQEDGKESPQE